MTKPRPNVSPSTGTCLIPRPSTMKRTNLMTKAEWKNSAAHSYVRDKAKAIQASLDARYPSFIKFLLSSHAKFDILNLPADFRRCYLRNDDIITLVGEDGMRFPVVYLAYLGLRGGWKDFFAAYNLQVGDALVCHLVSKHELKVYCVRVSDLDHRAQEEKSGIEERDEEVVCQDMTSHVDQNLVEDHELGDQGFIFESGKDDFSYIDKEGELAENVAGKYSSPEPFVDLKNFKIVVNGSLVDPLVSVSARVKYYELCLARNSYLHSELRSNHQLATGIILETVRIIDAIKACCLSTSQSNIKEWETNLEGFKLLGMDVGFLLDRVKELSRLAAEYQESGEAKRFYEATKKEKHLDEEIASVETKLMELKQARATLQSEREVFEAHFMKLRLMFQETAKMAW
ncbi:unnamed protein product [Cuscuta campestris]|uniref:TF-B3 domain-containing protein n=1 Tax=Cuscuta campestris TaxID=132261 RepID=A0A484L853_9ASTE|nr:unnamed protein product [Cuscuta campestris]